MKTTRSLLALLFLTGCNDQTVQKADPLEQWTGAEVTVYFNRNMLGAAGNPIAPTSTWLNNTKVSLPGRILSTEEDGIFLDSRFKINSGDSELRHSIFWIPSSSILTIERRQK